MDDDTHHIHESKGINREVQKISKDIQTLEENITYATYLATLHESEKQVILWRTIALALVAFLGFCAIIIFAILLSPNTR